MADSDPCAGLEDGPWVLAHLGQSLDGRIATASGKSHYVTGQENIVHLHRLRALADCVLVGAGTVAADDPALTVRHVPGRNPVRAVIDPMGRLPRDRRIFTDGEARTLVLTGTVDGPGERFVLPARPEGIAPADILSALRGLGLSRIFIEGGGRTVSGFLQAGLLDRLQIAVAPMLIGSGVPAITLPVIDSLDSALRPPCRIHPMGADVLFDFDLRKNS
ncbi:RibD family protein [Oceanibaculum indicum]|uniref:Deaminase-reductase domain-containing protein n=1 Tax=Oceanibaculum indicum P24 TaxID=1207063 RepID=K2JPA0_9PROT|nr:RibD family protein [Oceanibaculum indicum]EKE76377.1 deaminase-reductase domain-containing protein [Oceanibaculum indicum P24]